MWVVYSINPLYCSSISFLSVSQKPIDLFYLMLKYNNLYFRTKFLSHSPKCHNRNSQSHISSNFVWSSLKRLQKIFLLSTSSLLKISAMSKMRKWEKVPKAQTRLTLWRAYNGKLFACTKWCGVVSLNTFRRCCMSMQEQLKFQAGS